MTVILIYAKKTKKTLLRKSKGKMPIRDWQIRIPSFSMWKDPIFLLGLSWEAVANVEWISLVQQENAA